MVKQGGKLSATAYLLSQAKLIAGLVETAFTYADYKTFQVPVRQVEKMTGLNFGKLRNADPLKNAAESAGIRELVSAEQIRLLVDCLLQLAMAVGRPQLTVTGWALFT